MVNTTELTEEMLKELAFSEEDRSARLVSKMTQKELTEKTGIRQSNISHIENGTSSPTSDTLARLAAGMGKMLKIEFVPDSTAG